MQVTDLPGLANTMPHTFALMPGVELTGGSFVDETSVAIAPDGVSIKSPYSLKGLAAAKDGRQVVEPLQPVEGTLEAKVVPAGGAMPDVRNIVLKLSSPFARIDGGGESLADVKITGSYDLKQLRQDLGQLFRLEQLQDGRGDFLLTTSGDFTKAGGAVNVQANVNARNLAIKLPAAVWNEPWLALNCRLDVLRDEKDALKAVRNLAVSLQTGDAQSPTVDVLVNGEADFAGNGALAGARFAVKKANINLPKAQEEFAAFVPAMRNQPVSVAGGNVVATVAGSYDGATLVIAKESPLSVVVRNLQVRKNSGQALPVDENIDVLLAGAVKTAGGAMDAALSSFSVAAGKLVNVQKTGDKDFVVKLSADGRMQPNGGLTLWADLGRLNALSQAMGAGEAAAHSAKVGDLRSGILNGTVALSPNEKPAFNNIDANLTADLSLATSREPLNEKIGLLLSAVAQDDFSTLTANVDVTSSLATTRVRDAQVVLSQKQGERKVTPGLFDMVPKAQVEVDVKDLAGVMAVADAFSPPAAAPERAVSGSDVIGRRPGAVVAGELPPLRLLSGSAYLKTVVSREAGKTTTLNQQVVVRDLSFSRGAVTYTAAKEKPNTINLAVAIDTKAGEAGASVLQQIEKLSISQLDADLVTGTLKMTQPIVIGDVGGLMRSLSGGASGATPVKLAGSFAMAGKIANVTNLLEAMQGKQPGEVFPVSGDYEATQAVSAQGTNVQLAGGFTASQLRVFQGEKVAFAEEKLQLANDVAYDTQSATAVFNNVRLDMASSDALHVMVSGRVVGLNAQRQFDNVQVKLTPDLAKLWAMVKPMLPPDKQETLGDIAVSGKKENSFTISGRFPADQPLAVAIKPLNVRGELNVGSFEWKSKGLKVENLTIPVNLNAGLLQTVYMAAQGVQLPKPADCNGGKLDLGGIGMNLAYPMPHLSIVSGQKILQNVQVNAMLGSFLLGAVNPIFLNPKDMAGEINLTAVECRDLPLTWLMPGEKGGEPSTPEKGGRAEFVFSVTPITIDSPIMSQLRQIGGRSGQIAGNIKDAHVVIENGQITSNLPLNLDNNQLTFDGTVRMSDRQIVNMDLAIPKGFISDTLIGTIPGIPTKNIQRALPAVIHVPMRGPMDKPEFNVAEAVAKSIAPGNLLPGLLGGGGKSSSDAQPSQGGQQANPPTQDNPVGDLIDLFGKKKKSKK